MWYCTQKHKNPLKTQQYMFVCIHVLKMTSNRICCQGDLHAEVWLCSKYLNATIPPGTDIQESILVNGDPMWVTQFFFPTALLAK